MFFLPNSGNGVEKSNFKSTLSVQRTTAVQSIVEHKEGDLTIIVTFPEALDEPIYKIIDAVKGTLEKTPPELAADVMDHGIMMTGGGALLKNLDQLLAHETGMPVLVAEDPLSCVGEGTGKSLENIELLKRVVMTSKKLRQ